MPFSATAWAHNLALYDTIRDMPFNRELGSGSLSLDRFRHYMIQDAHYLVAFAQTLALCAAKTDDPEQIVQFSHAASGAVAVERELHTFYFNRFGLSAAEVASIPASPTCHHYGHFLIATGFRAPLPVVLAAMLPCFWVYREVGRHILETSAGDNPYQAWIDTYGGADFSEAVDRMIATTDASATAAGDAMHPAMHRAFTRATQLEWMFWDSAYRLEQWPV